MDFYLCWQNSKKVTIFLICNPNYDNTYMYINIMQPLFKMWLLVIVFIIMAFTYYVTLVDQRGQGNNITAWNWTLSLTSAFLICYVMFMLIISLWKIKIKYTVMVVISLNNLHSSFRILYKWYHVYLNRMESSIQHWITSNMFLFASIPRFPSPYSKMSMSYLKMLK